MSFLKDIKFLFYILFLLVASGFLGVYWVKRHLFPQEDPISPEAYEAVKDALAEKNKEVQRLDSIRRQQIEKEATIINELRNNNTYYKSILRTHKSTQLTKDAIIRRVREDSTYLATELQRLRDSIADEDEVYYLSQGENLEKEITLQEQIIHKHEETEVHFIKQDSIQKTLINSLTEQKNTLAQQYARETLLRINEQCKRSGIPGTLVRFGVKSKCVKKKVSKL